MSRMASKRKVLLAAIQEHISPNKKNVNIQLKIMSLKVRAENV